MNNAFAIIDKDTGNTLATLPLTIAIGATVEGYERAGMNVKWTWAELQLPCPGCNAEAGEECRWGCMSNVS